MFYQINMQQAEAALACERVLLLSSGALWFCVSTWEINGIICLTMLAKCSASSLAPDTCVVAWFLPSSCSVEAIGACWFELFPRTFSPGSIDPRMSIIWERVTRPFCCPGEVSEPFPTLTSVGDSKLPVKGNQVIIFFQDKDHPISISTEKTEIQVSLRLNEATEPKQEPRAS